MAESEKNLGYAFEAIDNIRNNLESYRIQHNNGFPILKELIQNANDAEATEMVLKYFPGDNSADHPLLKGNQGIYVYNNGPFTETNEIAMRTIGGSDKKKNTDKVGKYGLGMKSIYHVCDFFFYIVDGKRVEFLNPWYKANNPNYIHNDWSVLTERDKEIIKKYSPKTGEGLSILIPGKLDFKDAVKNEEWHISTGNSVKMDFPFGTNLEDLIKDLMHCLALLQVVSVKGKSHLETIYYEINETKSIKIYKKSNTKIVCEDNKGKIIKTADFASFSSSKLVDESKLELFRILDDKKLIGDKIVEEEKLRKTTFELIKTDLPAEKKGAGKLDVKFCVFLPLQKPAHLEADIYTDSDYTLLINAPYIIDHGRQGMFGYDSLVDEIKEETVLDISYKESASKCWNQLLSQNIVFPHLPNLFETVLSTGVCLPNDIQNILIGLKRIAYSDKNVINTYTTSAYGFAKKYSVDKNKLISNWDLLELAGEKKNKFLYIPEHLNIEHVLNVFPSIKDCSEDVIYISGNNNSSFLLPKEYSPDSEIVKKIILDFKKENFVDKSEISLVKEFIEQLKPIFNNNPDLCATLINKIKKSFLQLELSDISASKSALSDLLNTVNNITGDSSYKVYAVDSTNIGSLKITYNDWKKMWTADSDFIIVPKILTINSSWSEEYKEKFLLGTEEDRSKSLCQFLIDNNLSGLSQNTVINGIVNVRKYIKKIIENFKDICIFGIINIRTQSKVEYKNSVDFFELLQNKRVFNSVGVTVKVEELIYKYAKLLPTYDIYALLSKDDTDNFGIEDTSLIIENSADGVLTSLKNQDYKNLEYSEDYKALFINEVLRIPFLINDEDVDFYKFLLAGFRDITLLNPDSSYLNAFSTECDPRWKRVFEICKSPATIMIPKEYDDCIKFAKKNEIKLGLNFLNDKSCFEQLNAYSWNNNPVDFILTDRELNSEDFLTSILEKMSETDDRHKTLFKKLPFQKNYLTNEIVPYINDNCYLNESKIDFPKGFESNRILIKMDENDRIRGFQEKFMKDRILTFGIAVKIVLEEKEPDDNYADWIFMNMMNASGKDLTLIKQTVASKKWIPTDSGENCALNEVLSSNLLSDDSCDAICGTVDFFTLDELRINDDSKKFIIKKELIPQILPEVFLVLVKKLNNCHEFYIPFNSYDELKAAAHNLDSSAKFPIFNIIRELDRDKNINNKEIIFRDLYQKLDLINPSLEQYIEALNYLSEKEINPGVLDIYCHILNRAITIPGFIISSIKYPNRVDSWKDANFLTASDSDSISGEYLLNQRVYSIIESHLPKSFVPSVDADNGKNNLTDATDNSKIETFFNTWRNKSDHSKLVDLALFLLRGNFRQNAISHTPEEKFNYLSTQFKYETFILTSDYWNYGYTREQAFADNGYRAPFKVLIQTPQDNYMVVVSLTNKNIKVPIKQSNFTNPIIFRPIYLHEENKVWMQLNKIPTDAKVSDDYAKNLIHLIFKHVYFQTSEKSGTEIERLFENFCNSSQRTIEGTKERIFDDLFGILPSLSVKNPIFEKLNYELTECYDKKTAKTFDEQKFAIERASIIHKLIDELSKSKELEDAIFTAVKQKVHLNQYMPENVLFELFQNADDCVNDLVVCKKKLSDQNKKFIIKIVNNKIIVSHFGRGINDSLQTSNTKLQGKFRQDLLNMLSLNASDKDSADGHTGKFGLGFKSIYKVCNQPIVRSGELNFKIIAGIYPENIPAVSDMNIAGCLETRYELEKISTVDMETITDDFERAASFLTLFSKQINEIYLDGRKFKMNYKSLFEEGDNSIQSVSYENDEFLLFSCNSSSLNYKILFKIKNGKIEDISETDDPKLWCLTPLESVKNLPFYLNSDFNVDTGRKNLASDNIENKANVEKISVNFANLLSMAKSVIGDEFFSDIYELIVHASNMQEQTFSEFKKFGKDIIDILQKKTGIIPSGWGGPTIILSDKSKVFYLPPTKYDPNVANLAKILEPVHTFLKNINENYWVITKSASDSIPDTISNKIDLLELDSILNLIKSKELSPEILNLYLNISTAIPNYHLMHRVNNLDTFKLLNEKDQYTLCLKIILEEKAPKGCGLSKKYSNEIRSLLKDNSLFAENLNKSQQEEIESLKKGQLLPESEETEPSDLEVLLANRESLLRKYYGNVYIPTFYDSDKEYKISNSLIINDLDIEMNDTWCILLLTALCQSLNFWGHSDVSIKNAILSFKDSGIISLFLNRAKTLNDVYDEFINRSKYEEQFMRPFEMLLRLYKIRENFEIFYDRLRTLPDKPNFENFNEFLITATDSDLSGSSIDLPALNRSLKYGGHFLIRELLRNGFWAENYSSDKIQKLEKFAYMPKRKVLRGLGFETPTDSQGIYNELLNQIPHNPTLDYTFDILLLAEEK